MALEIKKTSDWWYGRLVVDQKAIVRNLGVKIEGRRPESLRQVGDVVFERSRTRAQVALEKLQADMKRQTSAEELIQAVHEIRTGRRITSISLGDVYARWESYPRHRPPTERYREQVKRHIERFVSYLRSENPAIKDMSGVRSDDVRRFLEAENARGVTAKTYNNVLICLRSVFTLLRRDAGCAENPFELFSAKETATIFRKPYTPNELSAILEAAKSDPFILPIIVTGICTAMRRGDCCLLPWRSVDFATRFLSVKTSKTGELVEIPMFPLLEKTLQEAVGADQKYVFPQQALMYKSNPDGITYRVKKVLELAGFSTELEGESAAEATPPGSLGGLNQKRRKGLRNASVRDFHSFRVTWVTLALTAGVPIEVVKRVTGHQTAEIVQKHYFQPGK